MSQFSINLTKIEEIPQEKAVSVQVINLKDSTIEKVNGVLKDLLTKIVKADIPFTLDLAKDINLLAEISVYGVVNYKSYLTLRRKKEEEVKDDKKETI